MYGIVDVIKLLYSKGRYQYMKLVHLSDLHLGKRVNEFPMLEDQKYILKEIMSLINDEKPDGVIVAGDVYDRTVPAEDAMKVWDDFLVSLSRKKIPVYAISGNHDSAIRFSDHSALVESTGIRLAPVYDGNVRCITAEDEHGKLNIYMLPFVKPIVVRSIFPDEEINDYTDACRVAIEHMNVNTDERNILIAHQFVTGAERCDSEEISVGGLDNVDAGVFAPFDYVALGHLHKAQSVQRDTIRYCGTPLKYSFSEVRHNKSVTMLEFGAKGKVDIREIALKPSHDMREIKGTYDELMLKDNYEGTATDDYLHVILTDENDVIDAINKMRTVYPNIMKISYDNKRTRSDMTLDEINNIEEKSPMELFDEFYEKQNGQTMDEEQSSFIKECISSIWEG
jgi:exonuclease SbcD